MNGEINWGPEIRVDGLRPEWLEPDQEIMMYDGEWWGRPETAALFYGYDIGERETAIRLPADHPHYATLSHATAPNGGEVGPEVVERLIGVVRELAARDNGDGTVSIVDIQRTVADAVELVALLTEPVDGDLVEAERLAGEGPCNRVDVIVAAIKLGRALEKEAGR